MARFTKDLTIYRKIIIPRLIVGSTYDGDLQRAKLFPRNIASQFSNTFSDDFTIFQVNRTREKLCILRGMFCELDVRPTSIVSLALS